MVLKSRIIKTENDESFFVFGSRGTGKSTLIKDRYPAAHTVNLLLPSHEERLSADPEDLVNEVLALDVNTTHVFIDEIQKVPKLCDVVHYLIEEKKVPQKFILTGSSARKLKSAGANLLAGRAVFLNLYPFCSYELGDDFDLEKALSFGLLPKVWNQDKKGGIVRFLRAYCQTYLKEEVWAEHLIRKLEPFRKFLEVAAQHNTHIINYSTIAKAIDVDVKTVQTYFQILEETHIGIMLEPYSRSIRSQVHAAPRFYYVDTGIVRTLNRTVNLPLTPSTTEYGELFEQFFVLECIKLNHYLELDYKFSYVTTKAGAEIDLIIERPGDSSVLIEIKSARKAQNDMAAHIGSFIKDFDHPRALVVSQDTLRRKVGKVTFLHWQEALSEIFKLAHKA
jgi:predicted AAA+ superfamily ATPase